MYAAQHAGPAHVAAAAALVLLYILPALVAWIGRKYPEQPKVGDTAPHAVMITASRLSPVCQAVLFLAFGSTCAAQMSSGDVELSLLKITISVYNHAEVSPEALATAERRAEQIFRRAGIAAVWAHCRVSEAEAPRDQMCGEPLSPVHLALRILPQSMSANFHFSDTTFGAAMLSPEGTGYYSYVFQDRVEQLARDSHVNRSEILGHVAAHEIGHLLLGSNAHSQMGIMCANWYGRQLRSAATGTLLFTPQESQLIRAKLLSWTRQEEALRSSANSSLK